MTRVSNGRTATLVSGTGFGGHISGINGLQEFGKLGLNPGTNLKNKGFPETVKSRDFCCGSALVANYSALIDQPTTLKSHDIADLRDDPMSPTFEAAKDVYVAFSRALADVVWWLSKTQGVDNVNLAGGILQGTTRSFVLEEMIRRAATVGIQLRQTADGVGVEPSQAESPWQQQLQRLAANDSASFLRSACDAGREFFSPFANPAHRGRVRSYLPMLALDDTLAECERRFPQALGELPLIAGHYRIRCLLPRSSDIPEDLVELCCVNVFCKLQNCAMLGSYLDPSNLEGEELAKTLTQSEFPIRVQEVLRQTYHEHSFSLLIETYRSLAVTRQLTNPPLPAHDRISRLPATMAETHTVLGMDIGAQSWKAVIGQATDGGIRVTHCIGPCDIPRGLSTQSFFDTIADSLHQEMHGQEVKAACLTWPGAVDRNGPAAFSGIIRTFADMPNGIAATKAVHLDRLDIPRLWRQAWKNLHSDKIGLINDGTAFGMFYTHQHRISATLTELPVRFYGAAGAALVAATL